MRDHFMSEFYMHTKFMFSALEQANHGKGLCAPNPSVGAVAVQNGIIIAKAWHHGAGTAHAEQLLLAQIPPATPDVTLYVTLEPCNHWGRTPPCVEAIIAHGIQRVVYAYADPNPLVAANHTPQILRDQGIEVIHFPLPEIERFYQSYRYWLKTGKPWVTLKMAQTLDGAIAGKNGERIAISNESCFEFTQECRRGSDVILTTARTIIQDDPQLTARVPGSSPCAKHVAILDADLQVQPNAQVLQLAKSTHIYYNQSRHITHKLHNCAYHPTVMQNTHLDLAAVLGHLGGLGYHDVWVEAGAQLFAELHRQHLVNQTYLYIAPKVLGSSGLALYTDEMSFEHAQHLEWGILDDNAVLRIDW